MYIPEGKDPELWRRAQARASFKSHFSIYLIMVAFFWALWYFSGGARDRDGLPWPVWPMLGWGIGVAFHYIGAYARTGRNRVQEEYDKLVREEKRDERRY